MSLIWVGGRRISSASGFSSEGAFAQEQATAAKIERTHPGRAALSDMGSGARKCAIPSSCTRSGIISL